MGSAQKPAIDKGMSISAAWFIAKYNLAFIGTIEINKTVYASQGKAENEVVYLKVLKLEIRWNSWMKWRRWRQTPKT